RSAPRKCVDIRRFEVLVAVDAEVAPALVIAQDDDDIRPARLLAGLSDAARQRQTKQRREEGTFRVHRSPRAVKRIQSRSPHTFGDWKSFAFGAALGGTACIAYASSLARSSRT